MLLGSGPAPGDGVAERVNPLDDLVRTRSSTYLQGASRARPTAFTPRFGFRWLQENPTHRTQVSLKPGKKISVYSLERREWLATHGDHPKAAEVRAQVDQHRSLWLRGYYGLTLGQACASPWSRLANRGWLTGAGQPDRDQAG